MTPQPSAKVAEDVEAEDRYTEDLKVTRYLEQVYLEEAGVLLLYSALSGCLVEVPDAYRQEIESLLAAPNPGAVERDSGTRKLLRDQGVLIPESWDEFDLVEKRMAKARTTPAPNLALTICPTINCNFRCTYCFQHHVPSLMKEDVQDRILAFIEGRSPPVTSLYVTWFGGEPLLALSVIRNLSRRFSDRFGDDDSYHASAITNGWNLRPEVSSELCDLRIKRVQITLDGARDQHDERRVRVGGQPTFDRIVENIATADRRLQISVRVNVDENNAGEVEKLFDQLDAAGLQSRVTVYFAPVIAYTEACADTASSCMAGESWSSLSSRLQFEALMRGYGGPALPSSRSNVCIADNVNGWVMRPDGLVFKCWSDVTEPDRAVLDLMTGESTDQMQAVSASYENWTPFPLPGCSSCQILPHCLGGCSFLAMQQKAPLHHGHCSELKHNLKETVATYYLASRKREAAEAMMKGLHERLPQIVPNPAAVEGDTVSA